MGKESKRGGGRPSLVDITNRRSTSLGGGVAVGIVDGRLTAGWALCLPSHSCRKRSAKLGASARRRRFCLDSQPNSRQKAQPQARFEQFFLCASCVSSALGAMTLADSLGRLAVAVPHTPRRSRKGFCRFRCERSHAAAIVAQIGVTTTDDEPPGRVCAVTSLTFRAV